MMKYLSFSAIAIILLGCSQSGKDTTTSSPEAEAIVRQSIEVHGGERDWDRLETISYNKITVLFDSTGKQESAIVQRHSYRMKPAFQATIRWIESGDSIKIVMADNKATRYVNNIPDETQSEAAKSTVDAAIYVLFQPFKLLDAGTKLHFMGVNTLDDRAVNVVKPFYEGSKPGDDEWLFYFDTGSNELIANLVNHNGKRSLIKNLEFDYSSSLLLHQHRKSYFVDSRLNIQYLRAEYFYTNYKLTFTNPVASR